MEHRTTQGTFPNIALPPLLSFHPRLSSLHLGGWDSGTICVFARLLTDVVEGCECQGEENETTVSKLLLIALSSLPCSFSPSLPCLRRRRKELAAVRGGGGGGAHGLGVLGLDLRIRGRDRRCCLQRERGGGGRGKGPQESGGRASSHAGERGAQRSPHRWSG